MDAEAYARASAQAYQREISSRQQATDDAKGDTFLKAGREAEASGDLVVAAQHYRVALQLRDDEEVRLALGRIDHQAQSIVYESSKRQASDAERAENWAVAAARYTAAYEVIAEPLLAERIAHALIREGKDVRRAVKLAEEAVMKEPKNAQFRITLAEACRAAGLKTRASCEAQRAKEIAPTDVRVLGFIELLKLDAARC